MNPFTIAALVCVGLCLGGFVASTWYGLRDTRRQAALVKWRARLSQLHEDHMTKRDAWTRQGNTRGSYRHDAVVKAAHALQEHLAHMPKGRL